MSTDLTTDFERFSDDIRHAMRLANREAKRAGASKIDTPHLLTAVTKEQTGLGGIFLRLNGLTTALLRQEARRHSKGHRYFSIGKLLLSPKVWDVISSATNRAVKERHDSVGTGGILLSMLQDDQQTRQILAALHIDGFVLQQSLESYLHRFMVEAPGQELHLDSVVQDSRSSTDRVADE